ncbi:unnamed protein product [Ambrosiozyma monospora]|uniref:Unnamed protein product n=1 Tax=Ambrosiozyma monospora TaxID=43982 RepID=A0A9W6YXX5_AMBMO|nr:unnamed protein product [Ambrosiozyma monospora]
MDPQSGLLSYTRDSHYSTTCYLYSISYMKRDDSYRNATCKGVSIITTLSFFQVFKPLLTYILHDSFRGVSNALLELTYNQLNTLPLHQFQLTLTPASRFLLSRCSLTDSQLSSLFPNFNLQAGATDLVKLSIDLTTFKFPIQVPLLSCISSAHSQFGLDLVKDASYRSFVHTLTKMKLVSAETSSSTFNNSTASGAMNSNLNGSTANGSSNAFGRISSLTPYMDIEPIQVLFNAMLLKKKVLLYCYDSCYNKLMDFILVLYLLFEDDHTENSLVFYPMLDLGTLHLIEKVDGIHSSYLVGTSNLLFKEKLEWDVYVDLDYNELYLRDSHSTTGGNNNGSGGANNNADAQSFNSEEFFDDDKRMSVLNNAEFKLKQFFKRRSASISNSITLSSLDEYITQMEDEESSALDSLATWSPDNFPKINAAKISDFLKSNRESNFFQFGFTFKIPSINNRNKPKIDQQLLDDIAKMVENKHEDDKTIFIIMSNYLARMKHYIVPSLNHFINQMKLSSYKNFVALKLEEDEYTTTTSTVPIELKNFIRQQKLIQSLPLAFNYDHDLTVLNDAKMIAYYQRISLENGQLLRFVRLYNEKQISLFHSRNEFLFVYNELVFSLDPFYLAQIIDDLLNVKFSWQLNKFKAYQVFKIINLILKKSIDNLQVLLMYFQLSHGQQQQSVFINTNYINVSTANNSLGQISTAQYSGGSGPGGLANVSEAGSSASSSIINNSTSSATVTNNSTTSTSNNNSTTNNLAQHSQQPPTIVQRKTSNGTITATRNQLMHGKASASNLNNGTPVIRHKSSSTGSNSGTATNTSLSTSNKSGKSNKKANPKLQQHSSSSISTSSNGSALGQGDIELSLDKFNKLLIISSTYLSLSKDELLSYEFKKFLSLVLNCDFFKKHLIFEVNDFVKLCINDFIDYHM